MASEGFAIIGLPTQRPVTPVGIVGLLESPRSHDRIRHGTRCGVIGGIGILDDTCRMGVGSSQPVTRDMVSLINTLGRQRESVQRFEEQLTMKTEMRAVRIHHIII